MEHQFNNKDYGDYFSALEKSLEKKTAVPDNTKPPQKPRQKKTYGGVVRLKPWVYAVAVALVVAIVAIIAWPKGATPQTEKPVEDTTSLVDTEPKEKPQKTDNFAKADSNTQEIATYIDSQNIIVVNCDTNKVVAARGADVRCYPASTTKIMTVLVAVDYIKDYNKTFTFSYEITDQFYTQEATMAGFADGEAANMTDMLYGAILESGADATYGIAVSVAGSEQEFVKLMNKKAKELGLKNTNFTNSSGLFDKNHYTTAEDMAVMLRAAAKNELCRKILSTYEYTTAVTPQHPEGILLTSTLFSYMYGDEPEDAKIIGGKTGFVNESGHCFATFGQSDTGDEYVCVTLNGVGRWPTVYDQIDLYSRYAK